MCKKMALQRKTENWLLFSLACLLVIGLSFIPLHAHADMAAPDSMTIDTVYVNRHLLETDDMLVYGLYTVSYNSTPETLIDDAFVFRLIDTDGTTELAAYEAYAYHDNGYGRGSYAFYIPAASAPTWGQDYYIRISGKPSVFSSPPSQDFIIPSSAWSSQTTQAGNQDELYANVITMANTLSAAWGSSYELVDESDIGRVLSSQGENYFRNAIPGLQAMSPNLFLTQIENPDFTTRTWNTTQAQTYENRFSGTWVQTSLDAFQHMFKADWNITASLIILLGSVFCLVASAMGRGNAFGGMIASIALVLMGTLLGWIPMAMMAVVSLLCVLYIGYIWFMARA